MGEAAVSTIPYDFDIGRRLSNVRYLRTLADHINRRVLETEALAHDCGLAPSNWPISCSPPAPPPASPAPALKFGQPRVTAVLNALCHFLWTADGLTNAQLRPLIGSLLGTTYTTRQMGYDLRRLVRKGVAQTARSPEALRPNALWPACRALSHNGPRAHPATRPPRRSTSLSPRGSHHPCARPSPPSIV